MPRKKLSGAQKRKKKLKREQDAQNSSETFVNFFKKDTLEDNVLNNTPNDNTDQSVDLNEKDRWKQIFRVLYLAVLYLIQNDVPFKTSRDPDYPPDERILLALVKFGCDHNTSLQKYVCRMISEGTNTSYNIDNIQDEVTSLMSSAVRDVILNRVKESKYFSVILDSTYDTNDEIQLSFTIRYVNISDSDVKIQESFISFQQLSEPGQSIFEIFTDLLKKYDLDIKNCRGLGYDHRIYTNGKKEGLQERIRVENPRAFNLPCGCHPLNILVCDSAMFSASSRNLIDTVDNLFKFFSEWPWRWEILLNNVTNFTLKRRYGTRWDSRIECLELLKYQLVKVDDALTTFVKSYNYEISSEVSWSSKMLSDLSFLTFVSMWYDVLRHVNVINEALQSKNVDFELVISLLKSCIEYLTDYRINGFEKAKNEGIELTQLLDAEPIFVDHMISRRKQKLNRERVGESEFNPEEHFRNTIFNVILDNVISSLNERLQQIEDFQKTWGFLFDLKKFSEINDLKERCSRLELTLKDGDNHDIDGNGLYEEIQSFFKSKSDGENSPIDVLNFIKTNDAHETFPNLWIVLRILLTLPVTVASSEQSFSKLEYIQSYLRSYLSKECLNSLAVLSIEFGLAKKLDESTIKETFANSKTGKESFVNRL